jgi:hypothetical protein
MTPKDDTSKIISIEEQKLALSALLVTPMELLARQCASVWPEKAALDHVLEQGLSSVPLCRLLYAMDPMGKQISANISAQGLSERFYGQDLSQRPFMTNVLPSRGFILSDVYVSRGTERPTITAVLAVLKDEHVSGFIAADFDLRDLNLTVARSNSAPIWRQIKGDPSIRQTVFLQQRAISDLDRHMDDVIATINELMCERGIFHVQIHFSSSRATLWSMDDPFSYLVHVLDEIINPAVCLAFRKQAYPARATVRPELVRQVLEKFRQLREADDVIYLRSGSLNVINGIVGLTFSCDGSHYIPVEEFLSDGCKF